MHEIYEISRGRKFVTDLENIFSTNPILCCHLIGCDEIYNISQVFASRPWSKEQQRFKLQLSACNNTNGRSFASCRRERERESYPVFRCFFFLSILYLHMLLSCSLCFSHDTSFLADGAHVSTFAIQPVTSVVTVSRLLVII